GHARRVTTAAVPVLRMSAMATVTALGSVAGHAAILAGAAAVHRVACGAPIRDVRLTLRADRGAEHPAAAKSHGESGTESNEFGGSLHASAYPASSTAARTSATFSSASLTTVTFPVSRSTDTSRTPAMAPISSETELAQWPQVMPVT